MSQQNHNNNNNNQQEKPPEPTWWDAISGLAWDVTKTVMYEAMIWGGVYLFATSVVSWLRK
eukprot:UN07822